MNFKAISAACLLTVLNVGALPAMAQTSAAIETYSYGTQLDIQKVISVSEDKTQFCGVVNAQMTYLDSQGQKRVLGYKKLSENCNDGN